MIWSWLAKLLQPAQKWIINYGLKKLWDHVYKLYLDWQAKKLRDEKIKQIEKEFIEAGKNEGLTPEERAKAQEDAFKKVVSDLNNIKP